MMAIKTVSLETARALKASRFRQDTSFFYCYGCMGGTEDYYTLQYRMGECVGEFAAPTTDELLEELPRKYKSGELNIYCVKDGLWACGYFGGGFSFQDKSLPEALAAMYLFLAKEGLLKGGK